MLNKMLVPLCLVGLNGCGGPSEPEFTNDPEENFETLWREFDRRYSFFQLKNINWDSLYSEHRPRVTANTTPAELFDIIVDLIAPLRDGHVSLTSGPETFRYTGWFDQFPVNFSAAIVDANYLESVQSTASGALTFGFLASHIGYIRIPSFGGEGWPDEIDQVLASFRDVSGIVIDIRHNGGGNDDNGERIAGRFVESPTFYRRIRWRDGPNHDDFTAPIDDDFVPRGPAPFGKPVAVLTNRRVFSSAESFLLAMRTVANVVTIGDTTGGGSANPIELRMPNGWRYTVSRWIESDRNDVPFEGVGIGPDIWMSTSDAEAEAGRDIILERAISSFSAAGRCGETTSACPPG